MHSSACQRSRFAAALSVDAELSQLEARALARHLERCPDCRAFAASVDSFTRDIRNAALDVVQVRRPPMRHRRRASSLVQHSVAGAVLASAAVLGGVAFAFASTEFKRGPETPRVLPALVIDASGADTARETQSFLRALRDASLVRTVGGPQRGMPERPGIQVG